MGEEIRPPVAKCGCFFLVDLAVSSKASEDVGRWPKVLLNAVNVNFVVKVMKRICAWCHLNTIML